MGFLSAAQSRRSQGVSPRVACLCLQPGGGTSPGPCLTEGSSAPVPLLGVWSDQDLGTWGCLFQLVLSNASFQAVACKPPAHPPPTGDPSLLPSHVSQAFSWQNFDDFRNTVANKSAAPSVSICWCLMCSVCVVRCIYF